MSKLNTNINQSVLDQAVEAGNYYFDKQFYGDPAPRLLKRIIKLMALKIVELKNPETLITTAKLSEEMCLVLDTFTWFAKNQIQTTAKDECDMLANDSLGG